jgi:NADH dehydrogenase
MEVWLSPAVGFDAANAAAQVYGTGENPISWISFPDVAQFAVACLGHPAAQNATIELGGPEALSQLAAIKVFEQAGGRPFEVQYVSAEALEQQQHASTDGMQASFAGLMRVYADGDPIDMDETLQTFPVQMTSVQEYAERVLSAA